MLLAPKFAITTSCGSKNVPSMCFIAQRHVQENLGLPFSTDVLIVVST